MKRKSNFILIILFLAGLSLILYPTFSDWWNSFHQSRAVAIYVEQTANLSAEENEKLYAEALEYNARLSESETKYVLSEEETEAYNKILNINDTDIMGYVEIPKINVSLPIYHGTSEEVLQVAVGHLPWTSLPVGGESSHCVISGHRGLPSARLFTDIDKLILGDTFIITVLDHTLTYEVDQIRIVLPDEVEDLQIEEGDDYCTLVTCTPYAVNTHRLLVRGHRIENAQGDVRVTADALQVDTNLVALVIGVFTALIFMLLFSRGGKRRRK